MIFRLERHLNSMVSIVLTIFGGGPNKSGKSSSIEGSAGMVEIFPLVCDCSYGKEK